MITLKNITKSYNYKNILKNVNLELNTSQITVLKGPSGSGKTTLLRNIALLEKPDSGVLEIMGTVYDFDVQPKQKIMPNSNLNLVFQRLYLYPHLTNRENILLALDEVNSYTNKLFEELVSFLGIKSVLDNYPNQSSLGQQQRVAIARVLILQPKFILFDEITSALDIEQTKNIVTLLKKIKKQGIGSLIVTHDIYFMENVADSIIQIMDIKDE